MKIYVAHSSAFDYKNELYIPIRKSDLSKKHEITLPHENSSAQFNSKEYLKNCDLVIAEVSYPSTGQGIELGWANLYNVPVVCIYKSGTKPSAALKVISDRFLEYNALSLIEKIGEAVGDLQK